MLMISLIVTMPWVQTLHVEQPNNQLSWAKTLKSKKQIVTNLQFYFHDTVSGKTPSAVRVAQSFYTENSPTRFGAVMMADDPLTESPRPVIEAGGPSPGTARVGWADRVGLRVNNGFELWVRRWDLQWKLY
ncbi:unnamed protein product [Camellia sinensis]